MILPCLGTAFEHTIESKLLINVDDITTTPTYYNTTKCRRHNHLAQISIILQNVEELLHLRKKY